MSSTIPPLPVETPLVSIKDNRIRGSEKAPLNGYLNPPWIDSLTAVTGLQGTTAQRVASASAEGQTATIAATDFSLPSSNTGAFRISWFAEITTPASVSSSLTIKITFTHLTLVKTFSGAAITGNTNTTIQSSGMPLVIIDPGSPISWETIYVSVGTAMAYQVALVLEQVSL